MSFVMTTFAVATIAWVIAFLTIVSLAAIESLLSERTSTCNVYMVWINRYKRYSPKGSQMLFSQKW